MQQSTPTTPKPVRTAKAIANLKLTGHIPSKELRTSVNTSAARAPVELQTQPPAQPDTPPATMDGVATQTDPIQQVEELPQAQQAQQPTSPPGPKQPDTIEGLKDMIKDLVKERVDQVTKSKSRSRSASTRSSRSRGRSPHSRRRYTPSVDRGSQRRKRSGSTRRRSSSTRSSRHTRRRSASRSRSRSHSQRRHKRKRSTSGRRSPRPPAQTLDARRNTTNALAAQYPSMGNPSGKRLPITGLTLEPYRCLPPDMRKKAKERRSRRDLSFPEHVCGYLRMVAATMDPSSEAYAALHHASQVAQDAAVLPWPAVREWTQSWMANIEERQATWHDAELFTNDRTRLSWFKGRQMEVDRRYPCPTFNKGKCEERVTHAAEGTTWIHACALCLHMTGIEKQSHGASTCRMRHSSRHTDDYRSEYRPKGQSKQGRKDKQDPRPKN